MSAQRLFARQAPLPAVGMSAQNMSGDKRTNLFRDAFGRANDVLDGAWDWRLIGGTSGGLKISGGKVVAHSSNLSTLCVAPGRSSSRFYAEALLTTPGTGNGPTVLAYVLNAQNWIGYRLVNDAIARTECVAGSVTDTGLGGSNMTGLVYRFVVDTDAGTIAVYQSGALYRTDVFPAALPRTGRLCGIHQRHTDTTFTVDNFATDDLA